MFHLVCEFGSLELFRQFIKQYPHKLQFFASQPRPASWRPNQQKKQLQRLPLLKIKPKLKIFLLLRKPIDPVFRVICQMTHGCVDIL
jgi:hypothetical protein